MSQHVQLPSLMMTQGVAVVVVVVVVVAVVLAVVGGSVGLGLDDALLPGMMKISGYDSCHLDHVG